MITPISNHQVPYVSFGTAKNHRIFSFLRPACKDACEVKKELPHKALAKNAASRFVSNIQSDKNTLAAALFSFSNTYKSYQGYKTLAIIMSDEENRNQSVSSNINFLYSTKSGDYSTTPIFDREIPSGVAEVVNDDIYKVYDFEKGHIIKGYIQDEKSKFYEDAVIAEPEKTQSTEFRFAHLVNKPMYLKDALYSYNENDARYPNSISADILLVSDMDYQGAVRSRKIYFSPVIKYNNDNTFAQISSPKVLEIEYKKDKPVNSTYYFNYSEHYNNHDVFNKSADAKCSSSDMRHIQTEIDWRYSKDLAREISQYSANITK